MSGNAKVVLWLGLFMVAATVVVNWSVISSTIFGSGSSGSTGGMNLSPAQKQAYKRAGNSRSMH
jgi:hypothetical protein